MHFFRLPLLLALGLSISLSPARAEKKETEEKPAAEAAATVKEADKKMEEEAPKDPLAEAEALLKAHAETGIGDFGSMEPLQRQDTPDRGVVAFNVDENKAVFSPMAHWEQYNIPMETKRWGRYNVRITYTLKSPALGVQVKIAGSTPESGGTLKKQIKGTSGARNSTFVGQIYVKEAGPLFVALYTPGGIGFSNFYLHEVALVPAPESENVLSPTEDGSLQLLANAATTWSENMRYEPKPEKNCLGFWTEKDDFAEWEFTVTKPGKYAVTVHQGCGAGGGSKVAVMLGEQKLNFTVKDTGGFQKWAPVNAGEVTISEPGTYRLAVKPETKNGKAIMDIQKVVLAPVS
ncbi:hypothetical protein DES53_103433 [Roseimicrobium gellanilyticum]|uniref:DUF5077 domain-containing protein n=1 Tax=Roseimicrobium gellanilyticum TaxID=748857 RepID=A0A366HQR5_9BACT|nr:hypothetical protein [Roseimicrobium gellanilyticum]RBP45434.1 hypothetical protein DES53_103433 [Roseimicrobium gellanilyticum]